MMSDHWKLLANILGTPGPAEPVAKETAKKKPEVVGPAEAPASMASDFDPSPSKTAPKRDPLADIVERRPDPIVPGFVLPEPVAAIEKPAKRSAWDTLIGSLGIKTTPEPEVDFAPPASKPASISSTDDRGLESANHGRSQANPTDKAADDPRRMGRGRSGFGSGLIEDQDSDSWGNPGGTASSQSPEDENRRPRREEAIREPSSTRRPARDDRADKPRTERPNQQGRDANRGEERPSRGRDGRPVARDEGHREERRPARRSFADGLIDWDDADGDDASLFVEPGGGDDAGFDDIGSEQSSEERLSEGRSSHGRVSQDKEPQGRTREENDRPRGRGRRGGSRNRGRDDSPIEKRPVSEVEGDVIGWDAEPVEDVVDSEPSHRGRSPRGEQPRRDVPSRETSSRDLSRREDRGRGETSRHESSRSETARDTQPRAERLESEESSNAGASRRRGRRGQRQQMGAPDSEPRMRRESSSRTSESDFVEEDLLLDEDDLPSPTVTSESSVEAKEAPTRSRRRRGRRGRGGSGRDREDKVSTHGEPRSKEPDDRDLDDDEPFVAELDSFGAGQDTFAAELSPDLIDEVMLDDDHEDDEEVERIRRGRRRGRGGRGEPRSRAEATDSSSDSVESAGSSSAAPKHRNVPTWLDTVSLLVDSNIERHRRSGPPRSPQGRGGRR